MRTVTHKTLTGESGATFSDCGRYRYALWRQWGPGSRAMVFVGLNPSTADERQDDPTIRRCIGFARREDCDVFVMLNLFGLRSTDPAGLLRDPEPIGADNDTTIWEWFHRYDGHVVAAWGAHKLAARRAARLFPIDGTPARELKCLGANLDGSPKHPLYVKADTPLRPLVMTSSREL